VEETSRKKLVTVIEQLLEDRLQGTTEDQTEYLEELKTQVMGYNPKCPPLEQVKEKSASGKSQPPPKNGKQELNDSKQKFDEGNQRAGKEGGKS